MTVHVEVTGITHRGLEHAGSNSTDSSGRIEDVQLENNNGDNVPANEATDHTAEPTSAGRRDLNDPKATFDDLPFKPQLTEKAAKRANQTYKGMILSVGFTLAILIPLILLNPAPKEQAFKSEVNLQQTAEQTESIAGFKVFAPDLGDDQYANFARWQANNAQGVPYWEFGVVTDDKNFVWVRQAAKANPTWIALTTDTAVPTGTKTIGSWKWEERVKDQTTYLITERKDSTLILSSDTSKEDLENVAKIAESTLN